MAGDRLSGPVLEAGFDVALDILCARRPSLVTHVFRPQERVAALEVAEAGPAADAVKVAFVP